MATICERCITPAKNDGGPEFEVYSIWPLSPCVFCGEWPGDYHTSKQRFYAVRNNVVQRVKEAKHGTGRT